jgi:hypothetical protein
LFSVPFHHDKEETVRRARVEGGEAENLLPAVYHPDPLAAEGSLVFFDIGWDVIGYLRAAGFKRPYVLAYYDFFRGYLGAPCQVVFIGEK